MTSPTATNTWQQLANLSQEFKSSRQTIRSLFDADPRRGSSYAITLPDLHFDYSKNLLNTSVHDALLKLASDCRLESAIADMFAGARINPTENRPALHVALRGHQVNGLEQQVTAVLTHMENFVRSVRDGSWRGFSGKPIAHVVNIGIGGSHLGPAMVVRALRHFQDQQITIHFISNVDPSGARETLGDLDPATTLFIIASKSFTTLETHENAQLARNWLTAAGVTGQQMGKHFIAVSSNVKAASDFGILPENIFPMWDWVGGRYSLWSAIGLPIALGLGMEHFRALLSGAHEADEHFRSAPPGQNIPVIMGLLNVWYSGFFGAESQAVLPYSQHLELFPAFLQQLCMESLGKRVDLDGHAVTTPTGMIVWGAAGTDGQHSFHQLLHQGTRFVPADFIAIAAPAYPDNPEQHRHLLANCFSQSQALMDGKSLEQATRELLAGGAEPQSAARLAPHKLIPGNRPSNTFLLARLDPRTLGMLTAFYEHSVYVQSAVWNINAFDQWGVELGKKLSGPLFDALSSATPELSFDDSTNQLVSRARSWHGS